MHEAVRSPVARSPLIAALVLSHMADAPRRAAGRASWLQAANVDASLCVARFLVGDHCDGGRRRSCLAVTQTEQLRAVRAEAAQHGDIAVLNNVSDAYTGLPEKVRAGFAWMLDRYPSPRHILKLDSDVWVQWEAVVQMVGTLPAERLYAGKTLRGQRNLQHSKPTHRNAEPSLVGITHFPPYNSGPFYITSADVGRVLAYPALKPRQVVNEDVYVGIVMLPFDITPHNLGAERILSKGLGPPFGQSHCATDVKRVLAVHYTRGCCMTELSRNASRGLPLCFSSACAGCGTTPSGARRFSSPRSHTRRHAVNAETKNSSWRGLRRAERKKHKVLRAAALADARPEQGPRPKSGARATPGEQEDEEKSGRKAKEKRAALRDGGRPADQSCPTHQRGGGGTKDGHDALVSLTAGKSHLDGVGDLMVHVRDVQMKGHRGASGTWTVPTKGRVDFVLLHWDMDEEEGGHHGVAEAHTWWWHGVPGLFRVTHIYHKGFVKLDFAREALTPATVCAYDYVFLWDSDVVLSPERFSFSGFVAQMQQHGLDLASPTLDRESFASYRITRSRGGAGAGTGAGAGMVALPAPRENWRIEVGFMVFATETFLSFRALLHRFAFKFWWFDTLPLQCILGARKVALLDGMVVHHGDTKSKLNAGKKTLKIDVPYTLREKAWRTEVIGQYGCCAYMRGAKTRYAEEEKSPAFFKCACDRRGLYC